MVHCAANESSSAIGALFTVDGGAPRSEDMNRTGAARAAVRIYINGEHERQLTVVNREDEHGVWLRTLRQG